MIFESERSYIQIFVRDSMVDCDYFTDFNRDLTIESNRIVLQFKKCNYNLELGFPYQGCKKVERSSNNLNFKKKVQIKAVYGVIEMEVNSYLVVVTKASLIGQIFGRKVFQVQKMEYFCLAGEESSKDKKYLNGLDELFQNKYWYFSDEYDLTSSLQQFVTNGYSLKNKRLEYMYNADWIDDFLKLKAYEWITGFISGYINIGFTHVGASTFDMALVTRRDRRRQGKRWIIRGSDLDGNTANTAQTQSIIQTEFNGKRHIYSHVQLRGSMPFIWNQCPDLKWSPKVTISDNDRLNCDVMKKNYDDILKSYQNCALINLIDKKGSQKRLGEYFDKTHRNLDYSPVRLVWFDFHAECKNMKYQNLSRLLDDVSDEIENYGYFYIQTGKDKEMATSGVSERGERPAKKNVQKGIFRTNCMDCLDRTNVVQSVIARQLMLSWMTKVGIVNKGRHLSAFERLPDNLEEMFRAQWTNNANAVSILYSGTPAMKTDFTATGKRTMKGAVDDGYFGVKRYFLGNFYDSRDQDFIDFSLGKIKPKHNSTEKIQHSGINSLWVLLVVIILGCLVLGQVIDGYLHTHSVTFHFKMLGGIGMVGLILFIARKMKNVVLRNPVRKEAFC